MVGLHEDQNYGGRTATEQRSTGEAHEILPCLHVLVSWNALSQREPFTPLAAKERAHQTKITGALGKRCWTVLHVSDKGNCLGSGD